MLPYKKKQENYLFLNNLISCLFIEEKLNILNQNIKFYNQYVSIAKQLYLSNSIPIEKLEEVKKKYFIVKKEAERYKSHYMDIPEEIKKYSMKIDVLKLPVLPLNLNKIKEEIEKNPFEEQLLSLKKEAVDIENSRISDITLAPFLRYYLGDEDSVNRGFFAFGIEMEIPLPLTSKKKLAEQKKKILEMNYERNRKDVLYKIQEVVSRYNEEIRDITELLFERETLKEKIAKNIIKYKLKDPSFSTLTLYEIYSDFLDNTVEILESKERIYKYLISIYRYFPEKKISDFLIPVEITEEVAEEVKVRKGKRYLYINSSTFNSSDNEFIFWFLKMKNMNNVIIDISGIEENKLKKFIEEYGKYLSIFGDISKAKRNEIGKYKVSGIFLNIKDYSEIDRIKKIKGLKVVLLNLKDIKKSKEIYPFVNKLFLNGKNKKNLSFIKTLTSYEKNKTGILLDIGVFRNENDIETKINSLMEDYKIKNFLLYSFINFLK